MSRNHESKSCARFAESMILAVILLLTAFVLSDFGLATPGQLRTEDTYHWPGADVMSLAIADVDKDGFKEVVTGGGVSVPDPVKSKSQIRVFDYPDTETFSPLASTEWGTNSCVNAVTASDVDSDGTIEIIAVGVNNQEAELTIWRLDSGSLVLEKSTQWKTNLFSNPVDVWAVDGDLDGDVEIVVVGETYGYQYEGEMKIWYWDGSSLLPEHSVVWNTGDGKDLRIRALSVGDVDSDGYPEIVTVGESDQQEGYIRVWFWSPTTLTPEDTHRWFDVGDTYVDVTSVTIFDVDLDGTIEMVTGGTSSGTSYQKARVHVWIHSGTTISEESAYDWDESVVRGLSIKDVDSDGVPEIVTVGTAYPGGSGPKGQLAVLTWKDLSWTQEYLTGENEWGGGIVPHDVELGDLEPEGYTEIVACSFAPSGAQLKSWNWNTPAFVPDQLPEGGTSWMGLGNTRANAITSADVDADGTVEIITAGETTMKDECLQTGFNDVLCGQLRAWRFDGTNLALEGSVEWDEDSLGGFIGDTSAVDVAVADVDRDGKVEIVTVANTFDSPGINQVQLRIWRFDGSNFILEKSHQWFYYSNTYGYSVALGDTDDDGFVEIVVVGSYSYLGETHAWIQTWRWYGSLLISEGSNEWRTNDHGTVARSAFIDDLDGDGSTDIVTVGYSYSSLGYPQKEAKVWTHDGFSVTPKGSPYVSGMISKAFDVYCADLEPDGTTEIVLVAVNWNWGNPRAELRILRFDGSGWTTEGLVYWDDTYAETVPRSLHVHDTDNDGFLEIAVATSVKSTVPSSYAAEFRVWRYSGSPVPSLEAQIGWALAAGDILLLSIWVDDVDLDGIPEILTSGYRVDAASSTETAEINIFHLISE